MKATRLALQSVIVALAIAKSFTPALGQTNGSTTYPIDLPTALRLAGAQNLDVKIARERLEEARAHHASAIAQFLPWLGPGVVYQQHDGFLQDTPGNILDVHRNSYAPGAAVTAQVNIGDALYKALAAKQLVRAAGQSVEAQRQDSALAAAQGYFQLAFADASVGIAKESLRINTDYETQILRAVDAGLAYKGDALRVTVQKERSQISVRQAAELERILAAKLSEILHLNPLITLVPQEADLLPLTVVETNAALDSLVQQTLMIRPELNQNRALLAAARNTKTGATYGPLIPTLGAQALFGGLGGGRQGVPDTFGAQEDYYVGLFWRIGPGGLFDFTRSRAAESQMRASEFTLEKLNDQVTRQVVEAFTRWQSLGDQLATTRRALAAAQEGLVLAQERKQFAVGIVLETIQAEQDLTRARLDYLRTIADFNESQYALRKATGAL